jgi:hypothetical protein
MQVLVDGRQEAAGSLLDPTLFSKPFQPPEEIPDDEDIKPDDWQDDDMYGVPTWPRHARPPPPHAVLMPAPRHAPPSLPAPACCNRA